MLRIAIFALSAFSIVNHIVELSAVNSVTNATSSVESLFRRRGRNIQRHFNFTTENSLRSARAVTESSLNSKLSTKPSSFSSLTDSEFKTKFEQALGDRTDVRTFIIRLDGENTNAPIPADFQKALQDLGVPLKPGNNRFDTISYLLQKYKGEMMIVLSDDGKPLENSNPAQTTSNPNQEAKFQVYGLDSADSMTHKLNKGLQSEKNDPVYGLDIGDEMMKNKGLQSGKNDPVYGRDIGDDMMNNSKNDGLPKATDSVYDLDLKPTMKKDKPVKNSTLSYGLDLHKEKKSSNKDNLSEDDNRNLKFLGRANFDFEREEKQKRNENEDLEENEPVYGLDVPHSLKFKPNTNEEPEARSGEYELDVPHSVKSKPNTNEDSEESTGDYGVDVPPSVNSKPNTNEDSEESTGEYGVDVPPSVKSKPKANDDFEEDAPEYEPDSEENDSVFEADARNTVKSSPRTDANRQRKHKSATEEKSKVNDNPNDLDFSNGRDHTTRRWSSRKNKKNSDRNRDLEEDANPYRRDVPNSVRTRLSTDLDSDEEEEEENINKKRRKTIGEVYDDNFKKTFQTENRRKVNKRKRIDDEYDDIEDYDENVNNFEPPFAKDLWVAFKVPINFFEILRNNEDEIRYRRRKKARDYDDEDLIKSHTSKRLLVGTRRKQRPVNDRDDYEYEDIYTKPYTPRRRLSSFQRALSVSSQKRQTPARDLFETEDYDEEDYESSFENLRKRRRALTHNLQKKKLRQQPFYRRRL